MDRYEYNIKADEIKKLYNRKDFAGAAAIADEIDWIKIKDNTMLNRIADIYENTKQYEKAKEVLLIAYERSPLGRQLAYKLTILSLRTQNFEEADEFYQDFVEMSPTDNAQYLLKYRIARAKGEELSVLIQILETYLKEETDERWQYELAKLYHDNGQDDKCVRMCNEIELWFNEGKYVTKARKLRSLITGIMEEYNKRYMPENFVAEHEAIRAKLDQKVSDEQKAEKPVEQTTTEQSQVETPKSLDNISVEQFFPEKQTVDDSDEDILEDENVYSDDETEPEPEQNEEKTSQSDVNVYDNQGSTFKSLRDKLKNSESIKAKWSKFSKSIELSDIENAKNVLKTAQYAAVQAQKAADLAEAFAEEVKIRVDYLRGITGDMRSKDSLLKLREQLDEEEQIIAQKELEAMDGLNKEKINQILATKSGEVQPEDTIETDETSEEKKPELGEELNHTTEFNPEEIKVNIIDDYDDPSKTANIQEALRKSMEKLRQELEEQKNEEQTTEPFRDVTAIVPIDEIVPQTQPPVEKESKNEETSTDESVNEELNIDTESGDIGISVVDKSEITVGESENEEVPTVAESEDEEVPAVAESENEEVPAVAEPEDEEVPTVNESENEGVSAVAEPEEKLNVQINREAAAVISGIADMEEISPESIEKSYEEIPIPVISNEELAESVRAMMDDEPEEEPVVEPVIEPIVEPVVEPVKEETGEAKLESSSESSVSQPKTSEILDAFEEVQYPARRKSKSAGKNKSSDISKETEKNKIVQENSKPADNSAGKEETLSEKKQTSKKIPQEYNELFSNFANLDSMEDIVADTLDNLIHKFQPDGTSSTNNVVITGSAKSGKTTLGLDLIKAANRGRGRNGRRVAKIKATALNKRGVSTVMAQILGADLIIEQAGNLMPSTLIDLMTVMKNYTEEMLIILEDDKPAIDRMLITHSELKRFFNNRLDIIEMGITEMVKLAREYARSQFYDIDEMGELALSAKLDDISGSNPDISIEDIEEVIDDAIDHANKFSIGKIFGKMKKGKGEYQTLSEQDFL